MIEAQSHVRELGPALLECPREVGSALLYEEHELLVLAAALALERGEVLHRGRVHPLKTKGLVDPTDPVYQLGTTPKLLGQKVTKAAGR